MRKNANMVLRWQNQSKKKIYIIVSRTKDHWHHVWNENFTVLVFPKSDPFVGLPGGVLPIKARLASMDYEPVKDHPQVTVSNNNLGGWSTGVAVLPLVMILVIILAISGNLIGLVSKSRFWGSVQAGWLLVSFVKHVSRLLKLFSTLSTYI